MRLREAHPAAFQENIYKGFTYRLYKQACRTAELAPLNKMPVWITRNKRIHAWYNLWDYDWVPENKRTPWEFLTRVKKQPQKFYLSEPKNWEVSQHGDLGRKDRKLVVKLQINWKVEGESSGCGYEHNEEIKKWNRSNGKYDDVYHYFTTDVEIFPLTRQQAVFVGAMNLNYSDTDTLFWGTREDVLEIRNQFSIALVM